MARTLTTEQLAAVQSLHREHRIFVDVWDGEAWVDLATLDDTCWVEGWEIAVGEQRPAMTLSLDLRRETHDRSLAPLMSADPLIRPGRGVLVGIEFREAGGDWTGRIELYSGRMNSPSWGGDEPRMRVSARSILGRLHDLLVEEEIEYGGPLEDVAQAILDQWVSNPPVEISVQDDPDFTVSEYTQGRGSLLRAVTAVYDLVGFWVTEKFRSGAFRVLAEAPPEPDVPQTPVATVTPRDYYELPESSIQDLESRYKVTVIYRNAAGTADVSVSVQTPTAPIPELPSDWPAMILDLRGEAGVDSDPVALAIARGALRLLSRPPVFKRIVLPLDPRRELGDWIRVEPNDVHHFEAFEAAVTNVVHRGTREGVDTVLDLRGSFGGVIASMLERIRRTWLRDDMPDLLEPDAPEPPSPTDAALYYSAPEAEAGFADPGERDTSLGGYVSTTRVTGFGLNDIFRNIEDEEAENGIVLYRALALANTHPDVPWPGLRAWLEEQSVLSDATFAIGLDPAGVVDLDSETAQGETIVDEETAPSGVSFSAPDNRQDGLGIGDLPPRSAIIIWVRLTVEENTVNGNAEGQLCFGTCFPSDSVSS